MSVVETNGAAAAIAEDAVRPTPSAASEPGTKTPFAMPSPGLLAALVLGLLLWASIGAELMHAWNSDDALSHGPLVPIMAGALLWMRRDDLKSWTSACTLGLLGLLGCSVLFVLAVWADVEFIKALSLIGATLSGIYYLGGAKAFLAAVGPLGFLVFMIPWPTSITERVSFPLQLMSSTYADMLSGLLGMDVERNGVNLAVMDGAEPPSAIYKVVVAQACSGLTSMMVLLALGYLICYFTPIKLGWRALLMATIIPLALLCNTVRLSVILLFGGVFRNPKMATWVHDNEGPVLIFFCSIALMGLRGALMKYIEAREKAGEGGEEATAPQVLAEA